MPLSRRRQFVAILFVVVGVGLGIGLLPSSPNRRGPDRVETPTPNPPQLALPPLVTPLPVASDAMGYELLMILNDAHVQNELALTRQQTDNIDGLVQEYLQISGHIQAAAFQSLRQKDADPTATRGQADHNRQAARREFGDAAVQDLTPQQHRRLDEIMFQLRSIDIFNEPEFVATLGLSEDQQQRRSSIFDETAEAMRGLRLDLTKHTIDRTTYEKQVHDGLVAAEERLDACLTPEQRGVVVQWRGARITFGRMHLRLVLKGKSQVARN